ncbi:recombinase family protein [Candidatus Beckwithbacteria bacterium]|nr:recombinase family protein [Candidatus Beckwithbacteria bacterium]
MNKKAIIYARTACKGQDDSSIGIQQQIQACLALAKKSGLTVVNTVSHEGVSGLNGSKKRLSNLLTLCKKKKAKALIVYDIERLSRNCNDYIRFSFLLGMKGIDLLTVLSGEEWVKELWTKYYKTALSRVIKRGIAEAKKRKSLTV